MTTQNAHDQAPVRQHRAKVNLVRIAIVILIALALLWHFGVFKSPPKIALVTSNNLPYWEAVIAGAQEAAKQNDVTLTVVRSNPDAATQTESIKQLLQQHYDGIAISPINPITQAGVLLDVANSTTLVTVDSDSPVSNRLCFVGTDNYFAGRRCGQLVRQAIPNGGEVIIAIGSVEKENGRHRHQGVIDELLDRPIDPDRSPDPMDAPIKGPQYTIVATLVDNFNQQTAREMAAKALYDHPDVKCLVGLNSYNAPILLEALDQAKKAGKVRIVGFDSEKKTFDGIEAGTIYATILQDQRGMGYRAVQILAENARGNRSGLPLFQRETLPCDVVLNSNVAAMRSRLNTPSAGPPTSP